ncbi:hypothetical protein HA520_18825 [Azotobacter chroococcum]|uniref:Uncharacterized protein n=1 Tax=Azotobacter chroococcum TaxID=353 RepID=A0AA43ZAQ1_9GAMM|nr:hypothetical protein [Azotobacter chroococcum]NHN79306.1 hypothetical protein [Azotobacter chroococcum]
MKAEHLRLLVELSDRPTATVRTRLIAIRRLCRVLAQELDVIRAERRALRRQAGRLRPFLPFTKLAVADLERQAASHRYDAMNDLCQALASFGRLLVQGRKEIAGALGFDGLCDLLNVNPVQRVALRGEGPVRLLELVFVEALEDSAEHQGESWKDGPLFNACHYAIVEFIHANAADARRAPVVSPPKLRLVKR